MVNILNKTNSIVNHFMLEMRDKDTQNDRAKFRNNLKRMGSYMAIEISKKMEYVDKEVATPLGITKVKVLKHQPVIIGILRAAIPFYNGFLEIFDHADGGFIGAYRKEGENIDISLDYMASPSLEGKTLILTDPMLATGHSIMKTIDNLVQYGTPKHIHLAAAIAAPEGIDYISQSLKVDHTIWVFAKDEKLDSNSYIVPGLGDAGDLSFGEKR